MSATNERKGNIVSKWNVDDTGYEDLPLQETIRPAKVRTGPYRQNFWKEVERLAKDWQSDNEEMTLMEYIEKYAPDNITDDETFEIIYPEDFTPEQVEAQLTETFLKQGVSKV